MDTHERRLASWWLLLVALTLLSFRGAAALASPTVVAAAVLAIAFIKVRIVVRQFMDVARAPLPLRLLLDGWIVVILGTLITMIAIA
ncbi:cytochrome C oxidase subunit IV family protein [Novosphingobium lentum]|uniref:cytochrome C oxidase subunit IV family protein n=1 Tax=Novosphingobium lentum TaxID=145287 RepID=UPI00082EC3F5|nr:cytochrome C oxidase subunit IV family protein [Novosphingobium lentum]